MKLRFTRVITSFLIGVNYFSERTDAANIDVNTQGEGVNDGLNKAFMERAVKAAAAAGLSLETNLDWDESNKVKSDYLNQFSGNFTKWNLYSEHGSGKGRDDAVFIDDQGQCFVAFQPTTSTTDDVLQNVNIRSEKLCNYDNNCCSFHQGFVRGWNTQWKNKIIREVKKCVKRCNKDVCLVISGHSQGGAVATAASIQLADLTPKYEVITYGAPAALTMKPNHCSQYMNFNNHYRFGKALYKDNSIRGKAGLFFDKVSFLSTDIYPGLPSYSVGKFIILSNEDAQNVAYVGFNNQLTLHPWDHSPAPWGRAHDLWNINELGYYQIMKRILAESSFPVGLRGFKNNVHCREHSDFLCISGRCDRTAGQIDSTCKNKLSNGKKCKADHDCLSERCSFDFIRKCVSKSGPGEHCATNNDCINGYYCPANRLRKCTKIDTERKMETLSSRDICTQTQRCPHKLITASEKNKSRKPKKPRKPRQPRKFKKKARKA